MLNLIKSVRDINNIKIAGKIAYDILLFISNFIKPGITTDQLDTICYKRIVNYHNAYPASLGYMGYPKSICTSINDVVCHGIPNKNEFLKDGDIINIDIAVIKNNYYADTSKMFLVGNYSLISKKLCKVTRNSINLVLKHLKSGVKSNIIGKLIEDYVKNYGFSVVRNYCGHGIGKNFHEDPQILHYYSKNSILLKSGMVFTIEPMVNIGNRKTKLMDDG